MNDDGRWSGPDRATVLRLGELGGDGLSVMPPGYVEFYVAADEMKKSGVDVRVVQDLPPLPPLGEDEVS